MKIKFTKTQSVAWCFSHSWETKLLENSNYTPTESGTFFKTWLLETVQ